MWFSLLYLSYIFPFKLIFITFEDSHENHRCVTGASSQNILFIIIIIIMMMMMMMMMMVMMMMIPGTQSFLL